jgi:16S rRNA (uracil1498-N3)-methyltransferase
VLARFLAPDAAAIGSEIALPADEAAHATRVRRLGAGDRVRVFDGRGHEWLAEIVHAARADVRLRLLDAVTPAPEPRVAVALSLAVLKGDKMDDVVRDAVMLGAARITPLVTARTEISLPALARSRRVERWQRVAVASAKQCGRAVVPVIAAPVTLDAHLATVAPSLRAMLVEPEASIAGAVGLRHLAPAEAIELLVGPEGGWAPEEVAAASRSGCMLITLAAGTLRADAAPIVALTAIRAVWNDL